MYNVNTFDIGLTSGISRGAFLRRRLDAIVRERYFSFPISGTDKFLQIF
jgi:hypothetical protein